MFNIYLLGSYYVPRTSVSAEYRLINKTTNVRVLLELLVNLVGGVKQGNKQFWLLLEKGNQDNTTERMKWAREGWRLLQMKWSGTLSVEVLFGQNWVLKGDQMWTEGRWPERENKCKWFVQNFRLKWSSFGRDQSQIDFVLKESIEETLSLLKKCF